MAKKKPEGAADQQSEVQGEKLTQREAVKRALAAGAEQPSEGVPYLKEKLGVEISPQAFSTLKSQIKKAAGAPAPRKKAAPTPASAARAPAATNPADLARQVKHLVQSYGADAVKGMVEVFEG